MILMNDDFNICFIPGTSVYRKYFWRNYFRNPNKVRVEWKSMDWFKRNYRETLRATVCPICGGKMQLAKKGIDDNDNLLNLEREQMNYCGECGYHVGDNDD